MEPWRLLIGLAFWVAAILICALVAHHSNAKRAERERRN